ncbi:MAG TPA: hypothetical protein VFU93_10360 [Acidimicrobiales bacterium]|nr:hypothetical protein [Acidimicrobiales bacterium]
MDRGIDQQIAAVAAVQHAAFSRRQVGVDRKALQRRCAAGVLDQLSSNVFVVAASPRTDEQRIKAATLDVPGGGVASYFTAAWLWRFPSFPLRRIEVTAHRSRFRLSSLAHVHHPRLLLPEHVTTWRGIDVTTVPRTIYDLAGVIHPDRLERLVVNVCKHAPSVLDRLHDLLPVLAASGRNGITNMRELLDRWPRGSIMPGSGNELQFEKLMANAGITGLRRQVDLGGHEWIGRVDYLDELTGVIFEVDSELHHSSPVDVAADEARDAALIAAGHPEIVRIWTERLWSRPTEAVSIVRRTRQRHRRAAA